MMSNIFVRNVDLDGNQSYPTVAFCVLKCRYDVKVFLERFVDDCQAFAFNEVSLVRWGVNSDRSLNSFNWSNSPLFDVDSLKCILPSLEKELDYIIENPRLRLDCVNIDLNFRRAFLNG